MSVPAESVNRGPPVGRRRLCWRQSLDPTPGKLGCDLPRCPDEPIF